MCYEWEKHLKDWAYCTVNKHLGIKLSNNDLCFFFHKWFEIISRTKMLCSFWFKWFFWPFANIVFDLLFFFFLLSVFVSEAKCSLCNSIFVSEGKLSWAVYTAIKTRGVWLCLGVYLKLALGQIYLGSPLLVKRKLGLICGKIIIIETSVLSTSLAWIYCSNGQHCILDIEYVSQW